MTSYQKRSRHQNETLKNRCDLAAGFIIETTEKEARARGLSARPKASRLKALRPAIWASAAPHSIGSGRRCFPAESFCWNVSEQTRGWVPALLLTTPVTLGQDSRAPGRFPYLSRAGRAVEGAQCRHVTSSQHWDGCPQVREGTEGAQR